MEGVFSGVIDKAFSIAVSAFLLLRMETELRKLRISIDRLRHCAQCKISPLNDEESRKLWKVYGEEGGNDVEI